MSNDRAVVPRAYQPMSARGVTTMPENRKAGTCQSVQTRPRIVPAKSGDQRSSIRGRA
ncbi:hypothetical protein CCNA_03994 [Caulobacter vibrioides NA1000]|uniref:Uncharacterized protein n=1 Tax=Caulobacter vibrioides (strain NA1000 / CB15N) TaxID=565050 RepID=A0A0H3J4C0_CAUVN|nr:hypothetical protein [Caulobacter vibrioides]YP_009020566.1 hypothetical protein CCNA_03994 [Caulobacter vibrioides NA1000]AHI88597.1 hypothetical protein CCNA_03994 [Caulobacter vibrioides NA1000]